MKKTSEFCVVYISTESYENAQTISENLVKSKLAACCSISQNNTSIYEWEGKIENRIECKIMCKTMIDKLDEIDLLVKSLHTDSVPEIIATPIIFGSESYLDWMREYLA